MMKYQRKDVIPKEMYDDIISKSGKRDFFFIEQVIKLVKEINSEDLKEIFSHTIEERDNPWGLKEMVLTTKFKTKSI